MPPFSQSLEQCRDHDFDKRHGWLSNFGMKQNTSQMRFYLQYYDEIILEKDCLQDKLRITSGENTKTQSRRYEYARYYCHVCLE